jgi:diadenosine tetraphosphate (Ap4A) HIT family hydrolase
LSVAELSPEEAAALGPLLRAVSRSLVEVTGCTKTYVAMFAELAGFEHVHFHVVPRMADLAPDRRGAGVFAHMNGPPAEWVSDAEMDRIGLKVASRLSSLAPEFT